MVAALHTTITTKRNRIARMWSWCRHPGISMIVSRCTCPPRQRMNLKRSLHWPSMPMLPLKTIIVACAHLSHPSESATSLINPTRWWPTRECPSFPSLWSPRLPVVIIGRPNSPRESTITCSKSSSFWLKMSIINRSTNLGIAVYRRYHEWRPPSNSTWTTARFRTRARWLPMMTKQILSQSTTEERKV